MPDSSQSQSFADRWAAIEAEAQRKRQQFAPPPASPSAYDPADDQQQQPFGVMDYARDVGRGAARGVVGFSQSVYDLADTLTFDALPDADFHTAAGLAETETFIGGLTEGVTQFALGFIPAAGVAGRIGTFAKLGRGAAMARAAAAGAAADFVAFGEHEKRLSNLIQEYPAIANPITEYLAADDDDGAIEGRLKNVLEGMALGGLSEVAFASVRALKLARAAHATGGEEAAQRVLLDETRERIAPLLESLDDAPATPAAGAGARGPVQPAAAAVSPTDTLLGGKAGHDRFLADLQTRLSSGQTSAPEAVGDALSKRHFNYSRLERPEGVTEALDSMAAAIAPHLERNIDGVRRHAIVREVADMLAVDPKALYARSFADASAMRLQEARLVAFRELMLDVADLLSDATLRWKSTGSAAAEAEARKLSRVFASVYNNSRIVQTEAARVPSAGRIVAATRPNRVMDIDALQDAVKAADAGGRGVNMKRLADAIAKAQGDPTSIGRVLSGRVVGKALAVHNEIWINGILSGMKTQAVNILSTAINTLTMPAERIIGGLLTVDAAPIKAGFRTYGNLFLSAIDSVKMAAKTLATERNILDPLTATHETGMQHAITARNLLGESGGNNDLFRRGIDWFGKLVRVPGRALSTADEFFKQINYRAEIRNVVMREADNAGLTPGSKAWREFIEDRLAKAFDPDTGAAQQFGDALQYARKATFTQELLDGTVGKGVQNLVNAHPALRVVLPFIRTPTNIFRQVWQMTPGVQFLQSEFRQAWRSADPMIAAEARGRAAFGGLLFTTAAGFAASGRITGGGPQNPRERAMLMQTGWQPYSIVMTRDDGSREYVSYLRLDPLGMVLGLVADLVDISGQSSERESETVATGMLVALSKNLTSKTYMTGLTQFVDALSYPDRHLKRWLTNQAGSYIPTALAQFKNDPYMREVRDVLDGVMNRIPGYSATLPPRRNLLGEPIRVPAGWAPFDGTGSRAANMLSPFAFSRQLPDAVKDELARLRHGFTMPRPMVGNVDLTQFEVTHNDGQPTQQAYDRYLELVGVVEVGNRTLAQRLRVLVESPAYQRLPVRTSDDYTDPRLEAVKRLIGGYRKAAMARLMRESDAVRLAIIADRRAQRQSASMRGTANSGAASPHGGLLSPAVVTEYPGR